MKALRRGFVTIALCSALAACASDVPSAVGGTWTAIAAPGVEIELDPNSPRLQFTVGGRINVVTSCSEVSAPVAFAGATIDLGEFAIRTTVACTTQDREIENAILAVLRQAREYSGGLPGDRLHIRGPGGELVLAQPHPGFSPESE